MVKNTELATEQSAQQATETLHKKQLEALASICIDFISGKESEITYDQATSYFMQNCLGISKFNVKNFKESFGSLPERLAQLKTSVSPGFLGMNHDAESAYLVLSRLAGISDEVQNLDKVESMLNLINILWLSKSSFITSSRRDSLSQTCTIIANLAQLVGQRQKRNRVLVLAIETMLRFLDIAREHDVYRLIIVRGEDL